MPHPSHATADTLDQAEEEILTDTVSDEALEAAAGAERGGMQTQGSALRCCHTYATAADDAALS